MGYHQKALAELSQAHFALDAGYTTQALRKKKITQPDAHAAKVEFAARSYKLPHAPVFYHNEPDGYEIPRNRP